MQKIINVDEAENFITNYNLYKSKAENQNDLFITLEKCESLAIANNNNKLLSLVRIFLTNYYIQINDLENGLKIGLENKKFTEENNLEAENHKTYSGLLEIYNTIGDYVKMEEIIREYQQKLIYVNDYSKLCSLYLFLAMQARNLKNEKNLFLYGQKAIDYAKLSNNQNLLVYAYSNFGDSFSNTDISIAKEAFENALQIIKLYPKEIPIYSVAIVGVNLSNLYLKLKEYTLSYKLIKSSIKKLENINNKNELNAAKLVLCELFIETNKLKSALTLLNEIKEKFIEHNNKPDLLICYKAYIQLYEKQKKYKITLEYYKKYQSLNEEIYNEETNKKIHDLQISHELTDLKRQRDHAKNLANLKHDFLANMSHEIRTPINSVLGISYLLQQSNLDKKQKDYVQRLHFSGENLLSLINDILDISKIEAGKMELVNSHFNLLKLLKNVHAQLITKAEEKNISFKIKPSKKLDINLIGDVNRLTQILLNLISNSIKFTQQGSVTIEVIILPNNNNNKLIQFKITDTGIGIAKDKLETIFTRYEQANAIIKTEFGGTGLGLSISKKLIDLMQGIISINSIENKGSTFTISIPFENADITKIEAELDEIISTAFLSNKRILIADDELENRILFKEILQHFNNKIIFDEAIDGNHVLEKMKANSYDLILIDLDMPEKNGFETVTEIRNDKQYQYIKIIAHTASLISMSNEEINEIGFNDLLLKPFNPKDLLIKLAKVFSYN